MRKLALAVIALTIARLWMSGRTELLPEEAYYWLYSQHFAWGYYDHPPMVALIIRAGTTVFGNTEIGVRVVNILLWIGTCGLLFATTRLWFDERVALRAAWLFVVLPVFVGTGFVVTPDGPLLFFWMLTLYAVTRRCWWLVGMAIGGAMLSKYYAVMLVPAVLWLDRRWKTWVAVALGFVLFSPVVFWNAHHEWASFAFQATRTVGQKGSVLPRVGMFWLLQLAVLTPVGLTLFAIAAVQSVKRRREEVWRFVMVFSVPLFLLFVAASLKTEVHVNWTAPAFLSLCMAGASLLNSRVWSAVLGAMCVAIMILFHTSLAFGWPAYSHAGGWRALAKRVNAARASRQTFVIGADRYYLASELAFYLRDPDNCVNVFALGGRGMGFRYWTDLRQFAGRPSVVVSADAEGRAMAEIRDYFARVGSPVGVHTGRREMLLINCEGYLQSPSLTVPRSGL